ncbi:chemotaxis response regulator protein-glutamate methylesterase [Hymenobacter fastidiosus]|uniref:protein-glutamate methylesterase n=1 Tax=Hymenobacter fastidiosus TaxID=486264 RepID=A0ABP7RGT6_9BACT
MLGDLPTLVRMELTKLLHAEPDLRVVGSAVGSEELVSQARRLRPGLILAAENQLRGLEQLAQRHAVPILLYSNTAPLAGMLNETARWGVYDHILPLLGRQHPGFSSYRQDLLRKIRSARVSGAIVSAGPATTRLPTVPMPPNRVIVIGGSTGGSKAVETLIRSLGAMPYTTIMVAVHLPASFTDSFVERLRRASAMPVMAGIPGALLAAGTIVVAPGGQNMVIRPVAKGAWLTWQTDVSPEAGPTPDEPSIDLLMRSVAREFGRNTIGVVLTGLGTDGTLGARSIRQAGGLVLTQNEASAAVFSMPKSVIKAGLANAALSLPELAEYLNRAAVVSRTLRTGATTSFSQPAAR